MEVRGLSATGIRDFLQCALKFVFRYDREYPSIKNDHAKIGIAVHEALEQFTRRMLNKNSFPDPSDYDFAVATFMNSATAEGLEKIDFYTEGKQIVTDFVNRFDPSEEIIDVEQRFKVRTPEDVPIVGAVDKVVKVNDDTIQIIDYKTSRRALTPGELNSDIQLSMYDLAASILWPEFSNRILTLEYVRIDKSVHSYRTEEQRKTFREFLQSIWTQINKLEESEVKGNINHLCGWCDYKTYCPEYAHFIQNRGLKLRPLSEMEDSEFLDHWLTVSDMKNTLEARQREMKMIASEKAVQGETVADDSRELYSTQAARTNYDVEDVVDIIPQDDLFEVLSVNKSRLDKYVRERPEMKDSLARVAKVNYNAPVFKVKETDKSSSSNERSDKDKGLA